MKYDKESYPSVVSIMLQHWSLRRAGEGLRGPPGHSSPDPLLRTLSTSWELYQVVNCINKSQERWEVQSKEGREMFISK